MMRGYVSMCSQLYRFLIYLVQKPKMHLENGMLIISIDVDVGNRKLGVINKGKNDENISSRMSEYKIGEIEEKALPLFVKILNNFEIPATFAIRGQLSVVNGFIPMLLSYPVKHDIGAHGYYHREFTKLSRDEAERELNMISEGFKKFGIRPRSFVFPKNSVAHLDLLEKHAYICYRGSGNFMKDRMLIEKKGKLYNIHPSLYLGKGTSFALMKRILDVSITKKLPFHVWFHLWNFGETVETIQKIIRKVFIPFFSYAKRKERDGLLSFETMLSAANKIEKFGIQRVI